MTMTMNHVLAMMEKCNLFDPNYNVKKCAEAFGAVTCDTDLLPQVDTFLIALWCQGRIPSTCMLACVPAAWKNSLHSSHALL